VLPCAVCLEDAEGKQVGLEETAARTPHGNRINGLSSKALLESDFSAMKIRPSSLQTCFGAYPID
jgi:hypothetical protein